MFIGREYELQELELLYQKRGFQMPVIYGRRRIGKSTLIREFTKGKPCIYYTAIEAGNARTLSLFSKAIYKGLMPEKKICLTSLPMRMPFDASAMRLEMNVSYWLSTNILTW